METGWLICVGNPFDGIKLYGADNGLPFDDRDEAFDTAEKTDWGKEPWYIVGINSLSDKDEES